jgi:beta-carotene ketolase (CrtW type)
MTISLNICEKSLQGGVEVEKAAKKQNTVYGLVIASGIISLWAVSLTLLLGLDTAKLPTWIIPIAILWQTFLYTGLFITGHDAMHGAVFRQNKKINNFIGTLAVFLYSLFSYHQLVRKHWSHHHHPASELDPDYHDGINNNAISWYFHFMEGYSSWQQLTGMAVVYNLAYYVLHISPINLILFWAIPPLLSSVQLFYFGTFLPHRQPEQGYTHLHRAQTIKLPVFWSFIACYHFGYHLEHHEYSHLPWWQLPTAYKQKI